MRDDDPRRPFAEKMPPTAAGRAKLLDDLYAQLATSENKEIAEKLAEAIERVWRNSGSDTVTVLLNRATEALKAKDLDLSLKLLDAVVEIAPDYAEGWNRRAFILYSKSDFARAVGDLRRVLALDPNHFRAMDGLATMLKDAGDKAGALKVVERLLDVHPFWEGAERMALELRRDVHGQGI